MKSYDRNRHQRRAATYAVVLLTTMFVATVGFAAIAATRVQNRAMRDMKSVGGARRAALAGLDYALFAINSRTDWRTAYGSGNWVVNKNSPDGTFSISATDPADNNISDDPLDPVQIEIRGNSDTARHLLRGMVAFEPGDGTLTMGMYCGGNMTISNTTLTCDAPIGAAGNVLATTAQVHADVEAGGPINGLTYHGTNNSGATARPLPNAATLLTYYTGLATAIDYWELPYSGMTNMVRNSDFEAGTSDWSTLPLGLLATLTSGVQQGTTSLRVTTRLLPTFGATQDLPTYVQDGHTYRYSFFVKNSSSVTQPFRIQLTVVDDDNGLQYFASSSTNVGGTSWTRVAGTVAVSFAKTPAKRTFLDIDTTSGITEFHLDSVQFFDACTTCPRVLENFVLSPNSNPFGSTNASGVYLIDCGGRDITIRNGRIAGTLIIKNPGNGSVIEGSMVWDVANPPYPALIVDGSMKIQLSTMPIAEAEEGINLNPVGTPYLFIGGDQDAVATDAFPSEIRGLVYTSGNLTLGGETPITGAVWSAETSRSRRRGCASRTTRPCARRHRQCSTRCRCYRTSFAADSSSLLNNRQTQTIEVSQSPGTTTPVRFQYSAHISLSRRSKRRARHIDAARVLIRSARCSAVAAARRAAV